MENIILEYLFQTMRSDTIKNSEQTALMYLYKESGNLGYPPQISISLKEACTEVNVTKPTFRKSLDGLQFMGIIEFESFSGRSASIEVKLSFLSDLYNTSYFTANANRSFADVVRQYCPNMKKDSEILLLAPKGSGSNDDDSEDLNEDEELLIRNLTVPAIRNLTNGEERRKKVSPLTNKGENNFNVSDSSYYKSNNYWSIKYLITRKKLSPLMNKGENNFNVYDGNSKISFSFFKDLKDKSLNDLADFSQADLRDIRSFIAKNGTIYTCSSVYVKSLYIFDQLVLDGRLLQSIRSTMIEQKSEKKTSNYYKKEFELNEDTMKLIPINLHNHSEVINGEKVTFLKALQNWLDYKKQSGFPVIYYSMVKNLKWLSTIDNPVESIETSIRKEAKGIFQVDNSRSNIANGTTNNHTGIYGIVRKFD